MKKGLWPKIVSSLSLGPLPAINTTAGNTPVLSGNVSVAEREMSVLSSVIITSLEI